MKILLSISLLFLFSQTLLATDSWQFKNKIAITEAAQEGVFHHLEGAGRKHIAVSAEKVAVVWEDDHSGAPQIYLAQMKIGDKQFSGKLLVSNGEEAYEPAIVGLGKAQFVLAWEQDGAVYARSFHQSLHKSIKLSTHSAGHVSLAARHNKIYAVWREQQGNNWSLWVASLGFDKSANLQLLTKNTVEAAEIHTPVLFPTIAINDTGLMLAWEDRQSGHTRLKYSYSEDAVNFAEPQYLNEFFSNRNQYDKGSGVTRVSIASFAADEMVAAWMDKRRGGSGYGIYAALGSDDSFGPNEKVHSQKGDKLPHYNPATAGNRNGDFVIAWDDFRLGNSDIWLSSYDDNSEWTVDYSPVSASGKGEQTHASIALDEKSGLHLIWVEREVKDGPTRLWYSYAKKY